MLVILKLVTIYFSRVNLRKVIIALLVLILFSFGTSWLLQGTKYNQLKRANYSTNKSSEQEQLPEQKAVQSLEIPHHNNEIEYCSILGDKVTTITNPDSNLAIVNKNFKVEADYIPSDLVTLKPATHAVLRNTLLRRETALAYIKMSDAAANDGVIFKISSGLRTVEDQVTTYNYWYAQAGTAANNFSALPGHSEHHLGTTIDILSPEGNYKLNTFGGTRASAWLAENAHKYGFALSYPDGKTNITGYVPEPWHYRYLGIDHATKVYKQNLSITEYLYQLNGICTY